MLRGVTMSPHFRRVSLGSLEPAFAVAVQTIDPMQTVDHRLAGLGLELPSRREMMDPPSTQMGPLCKHGY
jgi:hypothetical protein